MNRRQIIIDCMKILNKKHPLVSVIVPVYNVEKYLGECLDSILGQTYDNLQIICIDDASPDRSLEIIKDYAERDKRIEYIALSQNKGVGNARNVGLSKVRGEYISWIDSDDVIHPKFVETLLSIAIKGDCDIVECNLTRFSTERGIDFQDVSNNLNPVYGDKADFFRRFATKRLQISLCVKLFRFKLWEGFQFPGGRLYEETYFYFDTYNQYTKIAFIDNILYGYRDTPCSIMKRISEDAIDSNIAIHSYMIEKTVELPFYQSLVSSRIMRDIINLWQRVLYQSPQSLQLKFIEGNLCKIRGRILGDYFSWKERLIINYYNNQFFRRFLVAMNNIRRSLR